MSDEGSFLYEHGYERGYECGLEEAMTWQPIETAPKDGTEILACDARVKDLFAVVSWDDGVGTNDGYGWSVTDAGNYHETRFTHWMPLPEAPRPLTDSRENDSQRE